LEGAAVPTGVPEAAAAAPQSAEAAADEFEAASGVYTELQCGSYIFMDADYGRNQDRDGAPTKAF